MERQKRVRQVHGLEYIIEQFWKIKYIFKKHFHTTRAWLAAIDHSWRKGLRREILNFYFQDTAPKSNNAWSAQLYTTKRLTYLRLPLDCGHVGVQCAYEGITKLSVTRLTPSSVYELSSAAKLKTLLPKKVRGLCKLLSSLNNIKQREAPHLTI